MSSDRNKEIMAANILKYMDRKGVTKQQLCDDLDFKYTTFVDWINAVTYPRMPKIEAMANYFGIKKSDLIEEKSVNERIEEDPVRMAELHFEMIEDVDFTDLFEDFKKLTKEEKQMVKKIVRSMANEEV